MTRIETSVDLYNAHYIKVANKKQTFGKKELEQVLELCKQELVVIGHAYLLDLAYTVFCLACSKNKIQKYKYDPLYYRFMDINTNSKVPIFEAGWIIFFLGEYIETNLIGERADIVLPHFFMKKKECKMNISINEIYRSFRKIDAGTLRLRKSMLEMFLIKEGDPKHIESPDHLMRECKIDNQSLTNNTVPDGSDSKKNKDEISEDKLEEAKVSDIVEKNQIEYITSDQHQFQKDISDVRMVLFQANANLKKIEEFVIESSKRKVSSQLLELYNLIADTKDSANHIAQQENNSELKKTVANMDVFMDMITEYMADYGIQTIASAPGEKFIGKYHTIDNGNMDFDPRKAIIKASKRKGFQWDEQVLQKERVEI